MRCPVARSGQGPGDRRPAAAQARRTAATAAAAALSDADDEIECTDLSATADLCTAPVRGDPALLDRLLSNLVDNAVRHNRAGGDLAVTTRVRGSDAIVTVTNTGHQVPAAEVARLFEPFQRLTPHRTAGSGPMGLGSRSSAQSCGDTRARSPPPPIPRAA